MKYAMNIMDKEQNGKVVKVVPLFSTTKKMALNEATDIFLDAAMGMMDEEQNEKIMEGDADISDFLEFDVVKV